MHAPTGSGEIPSADAVQFFDRMSEALSPALAGLCAAFLDMAREAALLSRFLQSAYPILAREIATEFRTATGHRPPGSDRTKRLRKKRDAALSRWMEVRADV
jgi:hypothetical protein